MINQQRNQQSQEISGPYTQQFSGLNLTSKGGGLPPGSATTMHNCEVAPDGSVVRRKGSNIVTTIVGGAGTSWTQSVRSKSGVEYTITVSSGGIVISLFSSVATTTTTARVFVTKLGVWQRALTDVQFVVTSTPYDRVIIFTGNHPPVQVTLLDREVEFTCTVANTRLVGVSNPKDTPLWNNTGPGALLYDRAANELFIPTVKRAGFDVDVPITQALGVKRTLTILQVTWHWWAEALLWEGSDFSDSITRFHTTPVDQNVKIPLSVTTDLDIRVGDSPLRGVYISQTLPIAALPIGPIANPSTIDVWGHGNGSRFTSAVNAALPHTPFFATWGSTSPTVALTQPNHFLRARELRFNGGAGIAPENLDVYIDGKQSTFRTTYSSAFNTGDYLTNVVTYPSNNRVDTPATLNTQVSQNIFPFANGVIPSATSIITMSNRDPKWMGASATRLKYDTVPSSGGTIDGTYIPIYGIGAYCDYSRGFFHEFGTIFRDRLVLKGLSTYADQVLISATSDTLSPGEFYHFFQVTDALEGVPDDPFTVNITTKSREKITAFVSWQQSIIVFTAVSTYSINSEAVFGPDGYSTSFVASYGAFNNRCAVVANESVLFMNRFGVFDLQNKANTAEYASFERSEAIRPYFTDAPLNDIQDKLPWLALNDSTGTLYAGLPSASSPTFCNRHLTLSLAWNAWSTFSSLAPFFTTSASMVSRYVVMNTIDQLNGNTNLLLMGAPHNLDYVKFLGPQTFPIVTNIPAQALAGSVQTGGILPLPHPVMPVLNEYDSTTFGGASFPISKLGLKLKTLIPTPNVVVEWFGTNWIPPNVGVPDFYRHILRGINYTSPNVFPVSRSSWLSTLTATDSKTGETTVAALGVVYPSIYTSPVFNLASLGKLKRLKKLNVLFNTDTTSNNSYPIGGNPIAVTGNGAIMMVTSNYNESASVVDTTYVNSGSALDAQQIDELQSTREVEMVSIPLQGYGASYQFTVVSVAAEDFNILGYELEATPQRRSTYTSNPGV